MTKQTKDTTKLSPDVLSTLIITLVIISIFPLFVTLVLEEWPLQTSVIVVDIIYLFILAGYVAIFTGWYRPKMAHYSHDDDRNSRRSRIALALSHA